MSNQLTHTIIRASAGSGKTFQLANRYIALLLLQNAAGGAAPERLVAITFTRKGAGEFAERILTKLAEAAQGGTEFETLRSDLTQLVQGTVGVPGLAPGLTLQVDGPTLQEVLAILVDEFDRLALGTIDSFMARSVQTLAFELGLDTFEILEEDASERLRQDLLAKVFSAASQKNLEAFYQTFKLATFKSSSGLRRELNQFVEDYHELLQSLPEASAWGGEGFWGGKPPVSAGEQWHQQAREILPLVQPLEAKLVRDGLTKCLEWLATRVPGMPAGSGDVPTWLAMKTEKSQAKPGRLLEIWPQWPEVWHCKPKSNSKEPCIVPAEIMLPLKSVLESWLQSECAAFSAKSGAIYQIVSQYEALYDQQARRKGRLAFADFPLLLKPGSDSESAKETITTLAFRWFQQFDHWMLDEFQDTSRVQWSVLQPWLDEALQDSSGCKSVFVVGDSKQSIYGWRGGEPRLFDEFNQAYPGLFQEQIMAQSWRSRPSVLELVNRVCDPKVNSGLFDPDRFSAQALARWQYDVHVPEPKRAKQPGYAAVLCTGEDEPDEHGDADEAGNSTEGVSEKLAAQAKVIKSVLAKLEPIQRGLSCAILVRKNDHAQGVAAWLRANGVPDVMVEGDATLADQSPVVAALVDALRWLDTPAHTLGVGHIELTPLWEVLVEPIEAPTDDLTSRVWQHWREQMVRIGAGEVTRGWCTKLSELLSDNYARYCLRQVDQLAYRTGTSLALSDWRLALERLTVRETSAPGSVHVMTIHKAKGLGFDVVFLPDLDFGGGFPENVPAQTR